MLTELESVVYSAVRSAIVTQFPACDVSGEYVEQPDAFPHVSITEDSNTTNGFLTSTNREAYSDVDYSINIFSDKISTAKSECKSIAAVADSAMATLGFRRTFGQPVPNIDRTIFRYTLRYQGTVRRIGDRFFVTAR